MKQIKLDASARIMYQEAQKRGIKCTTFGDNNTILMQKNGKHWYTRGSRTSFQSAIGCVIANLKELTKKILTHFDLPTAKYVVVKNSEEIQNIDKLQFPLVMKPIAGAHGRDVIVGIKDIEEAKKYYQEKPQKVLFEEMLEGTEYRIVCVDFKFVAAAFRKAAYVTGDGKKSITQLIDEKNQHPWRKEGHEGNLTKIKIDNLLKGYLKEQNLSLDSIPSKNKEVILRKTANLSTGGEAWNVTNQVSPENKKLFEKIAKACDLNVIGIDMMCQNLNTDITQQNKAGIIEVNKSPGLRMHHYPMKGKPINIAAKILDLVEKQLALN
ncbi:MAG: ATP-grasp domain-containing protein [Candidatus Woesebacteria bacterium]|jgi:cyanophycin synthetase